MWSPHPSSTLPEDTEETEEEEELDVEVSGVEHPPDSDALPRSFFFLLQTEAAAYGASEFFSSRLSGAISF